jgi:hypothetical protein
MFLESVNQIRPDLVLDGTEGLGNSCKLFQLTQVGGLGFGCCLSRYDSRPFRRGPTGVAREGTPGTCVLCQFKQAQNLLFVRVDLDRLVSMSRG